jgi:hypothetical protein
MANSQRRLSILWRPKDEADHHQAKRRNDTEMKKGVVPPLRHMPYRYLLRHPKFKPETETTQNDANPFGLFRRPRTKP